MTSTGAVFAWGYNADGELGDGSTANSDVPVKVKLPAGTKVTAVAAGELHSLAVTSTGAVLAWGGNNFGQLGDGSYAGSDVPVKVNLLRSRRHKGRQAPRSRRADGNARARAARARCDGAGNHARQSTIVGRLQFRQLHRGTGGRERHHCRAQAQLHGHATSGERDVRRRRHPVRELVRPSVPRLHAARRGPLLPIARGQWHHQERRERCGPGLETRVEFAVSQSASQVTVSVIDMTHKFIATSNGSRQRHRRGHHWPATFRRFLARRRLAVPNFGTLVFSSALINGYPFGSAKLASRPTTSTRARRAAPDQDHLLRQ